MPLPGGDRGVRVVRGDVADRRAVERERVRRRGIEPRGRVACLDRVVEGQRCAARPGRVGRRARRRRVQGEARRAAGDRHGLAERDERRGSCRRPCRRRRRCSPRPMTTVGAAVSIDDVLLAAEARGAADRRQRQRGVVRGASLIVPPFERERARRRVVEVGGRVAGLHGVVERRASTCRSRRRSRPCAPAPCSASSCRRAGDRDGLAERDLNVDDLAGRCTRRSCRSSVTFVTVGAVVS